MMDRVTRERLANAIHAVGVQPSEEELQEAPLLDGWLAVLEFPGSPVLLGRVEGHPSTGAGLISTSPLLKMDVAAGYARTISRWYRLGRPMMETDPEAVERISSAECLRWHPIPEDRIDDVTAAVTSAVQDKLRKMPLDG